MIGSNKRVITSYGYLSVEVRFGDGSGMCNIDIVSQKGEICWTYTMGQHEEIPDVMGQYIWIWSVGNGGHHFYKGTLKSSQIQCVLLEARGLESPCDYIRCGCN